MASFEDRSLVDAIRVYRPTRANDAKGWWRYVILAVRYQVRCARREELWRQAGIENMNILAHIRSLVENCVEVDMDEDDNGQTNTNIHNLEMVVDDLHRENMALRKMIKSLLTPLAREGFVGEGISVEDIEKEVSVYEEYATKNTQVKSPQSTRSHNASPLKLGGDMEDEADDQIIENLANSIGNSQLNIQSPYESFLPSISPNGKTKRAHTFHGKSSPHKPAFETSPSYVEREALRRETIAKKKEQDTVRKADQLLRTSMLDNQHSPTSYLPVLKNRNSPTIHIPSPRTSPHRESGPSPIFAPQESESSVVLYNLEQGSQVSVATNNNNNNYKNNNKNVSPPKNRQQPEWCDNVNIVDKEFIKGRGRGRPREPEPIVVHNNKPNRQATSKATKGVQQTKQKKTDLHNHQPTSHVDNNLDNSDAESPISHAKSPRENSQSPLRLLDPKHGSEMSNAEKLGANAIAKARGKHRSKDTAKKPLTNLEKHLLKSPLALPVVKAPVNPSPGMPTMSPRERALRSNASPRVQSFIYPQKVTHKPVIVLVGGVNGSKEDQGSELSVVDKVDEMMKAEQRAEQLRSIENESDEISGEGHVSAENSVQEAYGMNDTDDRSYFDAPLDSPGLNLNSADISASPSPVRALNTTHNPNTTSATNYTPSYTSSAEGTSASVVTTASNHTNTHTTMTNNSASTTTPSVPHRSSNINPSPRATPRSTVHNNNKARNNTMHTTAATKSVNETKDSPAPVEVSPRSRKEQLSTAARLSLSPQRSPRHTTVSDLDTKDSKSNQNTKVVKRNAVSTNAALVSKSAPNSSVVSKAANVNAVAVGKLNLNNHINDTALVGENPVVLPSSPGRQTEDEKMKKKNILKSLNDKSNPNSPREKMIPHSPSQNLSEVLSNNVNDMDVSSITVGPASPA